MRNKNIIILVFSVIMLVLLVLLGSNFRSREISLKEECISVGADWNECSNKCNIMNIGNPNVACATVCEELCECAGKGGLGCPIGYKCVTPKNVFDAMGYCEK